MSYSSLHNHSQYSVLDGFGFPKEYLDRVVEVGCKAFAITEHGNQYSWVYFDSIKKDYPSLKMIYGVELYICNDIKIKDKDNKYYHLIALAKNEKGRMALNKIVTISNFEGFYSKPRVDLSILKPYADDLIIMTACLSSELAKTEKYNDCVKYIELYKSIFPHFYLEMQSHSTREQAEYNKKLLKLSKDTDTKFTITTDSHAATEEDLKYQEYHVMIARDAETLNEIYSGCYIQSEDEIHEIMDGQIGIENVCVGLEVSNEIADLIDNVDMPFQAPQLPHYPLPEGFDCDYDYLVHLVKEGWKKKKIDERSLEDIEERKKRLEYELKIIKEMAYEGYFLIVWDFIDYARRNEIIVGSGRGSAGGSLVVYLLGITELDPIDNGLIFERFLNPERVNVPKLIGHSM